MNHSYCCFSCKPFHRNSQDQTVQSMIGTVLCHIKHYVALAWTLKQKFRCFNNLSLPSSVKPFADEGSCRLPKRLNLCYSVLASSTDWWIWAYLVLSPEQSALLVGSWDTITLLPLNRSNRPQLRLVGSHFDRQWQTGTYTKSRIAILKRYRNGSIVYLVLSSKS